MGCFPPYAHHHHHDLPSLPCRYVHQAYCSVQASAAKEYTLPELSSAVPVSDLDVDSSTGMLTISTYFRRPSPAPPNRPDATPERPGSTLARFGPGQRVGAISGRLMVRVYLHSQRVEQCWCPVIDRSSSIGILDKIRGDDDSLGPDVDYVMVSIDEVSNTDAELTELKFGEMVPVQGLSLSTFFSARTDLSGSMPALDAKEIAHIPVYGKHEHEPRKIRRPSFLRELWASLLDL